MDTAVRHLPRTVLIPPCPHCGDRESVQRLVCGLPLELPAPDERDRVEFTVCGKDEHSPNDDWWCPACYEAYAWTYPFDRTLLVEEPWASMVIDGYKTWALRAVATEVRGLIGLTPWGSGLIAGSAVLADVKGPFAVSDLRKHRDRHRVDDASIEVFAAGRLLFAWEFESAIRFRAAVPYQRPQGAEIWAELPVSRPVICSSCHWAYDPIHASHPNCPGTPNPNVLDNRLQRPA